MNSTAQLQMQRVPIASLRSMYPDTLERDLNDLQFFYFVLPVRFVVAGIDMLGSIDRRSRKISPWADLPILNVAFGISLSIDELRHAETSFMDPDEYGQRAIEFKRHGDEVTVSSSIVHVQRPVAFNHLHQSALKYCQSVQRYLLSAFPQLADHAELGAWITGRRSNPYD